MKSFKDIAQELQEAILVKKKTFVPDEKGNLKKVVKKFCGDAHKNRVEGFKIVDGKCEKMSPSEILAKKKGAKKALKTKQKNASKLERRAELIKRKRIAKGLDSE